MAPCWIYVVVRKVRTFFFSRQYKYLLSGVRYEETETGESISYRLTRRKCNYKLAQKSEGTLLKVELNVFIHYLHKNHVLAEVQNTLNVQTFKSFELDNRMSSKFTCTTWIKNR